jgi:hypothetical protein
MTRSFPDVSKLLALDWAPGYALEAGFKRTVESFE